MRLIRANHSSYPRVGEGRQAQRVRRAYARRERDKGAEAEYQETVRDYIAEIVAEQQDAGIEIVTDGQVDWYDLVARPTQDLDGTRIDGLLRFFDTNYLVRQPEVTGKVAGRMGFRADYERASSVATGQVKPVITGPYTLARHSILGPDGDLGALVEGYAEIVAAEVADLARAGAQLVQIEEPSLLRHPEDLALVERAVTIVVRDKGNLRVSLVTYFGEAADLYRSLLDLPVDMLGFDLVYGPRTAELLATDPPDKPVALGAIDGRNTKLDDTLAVARLLAPILEAAAGAGVPEVHLQPSCGLEYLPRDRAQRKLERLREIADAVEVKT